MFALNEGIEGCTVLANREYLGDILSSQNFAMSVSATINPGLSEYFPWLSSVAKNYTQYRFRSLMFHYKSTSGALTTTQALGQIIGSANYNVYEAEPTTKSQLLNTIFAQSTVPSEDCNFAIECEPSQTVTGGLLYVRGGTPAQGDLRLYDLGNFYLATNGMSADNVKMGELWISYEIELYKPQLPSNSIGGTNLTIISNSAYTNAAPLGSGTQTITQNDLGLTVSGTVITFPELAQGKYCVTILWQQTSNTTIVGQNDPFTYSSDITLDKLLYADASPNNGTRAMVAVFITVSPSPVQQTLTTKSFTFNGTPTTVEIYAVQYGS